MPKQASKASDQSSKQASKQSTTARSREQRTSQLCDCITFCLLALSDHNCPVYSHVRRQTLYCYSLVGWSYFCYAADCSPQSQSNSYVHPLFRFQASASGTSPLASTLPLPPPRSGQRSTSDRADSLHSFRSVLQPFRFQVSASIRDGPLPPFRFQVQRRRKH